MISRYGGKVDTRYQLGNSMALIGHHLRISWPAGLLVLLATFVSLRWGEATALRRRDLDLNTRTVRIRAAYVERSTGEMLLGPPKSKAGRRVVGVPDAIVPALRDHLAVFVKDEPGTLIFPGAKGGPLRRGNFNKMSAWPRAVASIGMTGLHFHDLRHTGNQFAERRRAPGPYGPDGHDSERATMIYQHEARGADQLIANAIDAHLQGEQSKDDEDEDEDGSAGVLIPAANGTLMAGRSTTALWGRSADAPNRL